MSASGRGALRAARPVLLAVVVLLAGPRRAGAHHHDAVVESLIATPTGAASGVRFDTLRAAPGREASAPFVMPPIREVLIEHMHNKLVHFPIALGLAAAVLLVVGRRRPDVAGVARWLVSAAALFAVAAYFTGVAQAKEFEHEPIAWLARLHRTWGTVTIVAFVLWAILGWWKPTRSRAWIVGLVIAALILVTAYLGGVLAHAD